MPTKLESSVIQKRLGNRIVLVEDKLDILSVQGVTWANKLTRDDLSALQEYLTNKVASCINAMVLEKDRLEAPPPVEPEGFKFQSNGDSPSED